MQIEFISAPNPAEVTGVLATVTFEGELSGPAQELDGATGGAVTRAQGAGRFKGGKGTSPYTLGWGEISPFQVWRPGRDPGTLALVPAVLYYLS